MSQGGGGRGLCGGGGRRPCRWQSDAFALSPPQHAVPCAAVRCAQHAGVAREACARVPECCWCTPQGVGVPGTRPGGSRPPPEWRFTVSAVRRESAAWSRAADARLLQEPRLVEASPVPPLRRLPQRPRRVGGHMEPGVLARFRGHWFARGGTEVALSTVAFGCRVAGAMVASSDTDDDDNDRRQRWRTREVRLEPPKGRAGSATGFSSRWQAPGLATAPACPLATHRFPACHSPQPAWVPAAPVVTWTR